MRKLDRNMNGISFPSLYFPELYLLHGGYKAMFTAVEAKAATAVSPATEWDRHAHTHLKWHKLSLACITAPPPPAVL